jgi:hypothetical protein
MSAFGKLLCLLWVDSDCSKNLEPDIQVGCTDGIFIKSSGSAMAEIGSVRLVPIAAPSEAVQSDVQRNIQTFKHIDATKE